MKNQIALMIGAAVIGISSGAFAADQSANVQGTVEYKKNGGYEAKRTQDQTLPDGTKKSSETKVEKDVDSDGRETKNVTTETTVTPPGVAGVLDQKKDSYESKTQDKDNGSYERTENKKHVDPNGTNVTTKTSVEHNVDHDGNVTQTTKTKTVTDPTGLMNATSTETRVKTRNGEVIENSTKSH